MEGVGEVLEIWIDGGVTKKDIYDSKGSGAYSSRAESGGRVLWSKKMDEEDITNNEAEMKALIEAIRDAISFVRIERVIRKLTPAGITIYSDSQNVVSWVDGSFKCKAPNIRVLLDVVNALSREMTALGVEMVLKKIPREKNKAHVLVGF